MADSYRDFTRRCASRFITVDTILTLSYEGELLWQRYGDKCGQCPKEYSLIASLIYSSLYFRNVYPPIDANPLERADKTCAYISLYGAGDFHTDTELS